MECKWTLFHPVLGTDGAWKVGERMRAADFKARVLPILLAGTSRHPLDPRGNVREVVPPEDGKAALKALSLTGQALWFERPLCP